MTSGIDNVGHLLDELSREWHIELTACERTPHAFAPDSAEDACTWRLVLTSRRPGPFGAFSYVGTLAGVLARAYAGEPPDERGR